MAGIPNLKPTADDLARYGNMTNAQLATTFVDLVEKANTWIAYWPKVNASVLETGIGQQVSALLAQVNVWGAAVGDVMTAVKEHLGVKSGTTGVGFLPVVGAAVSWIGAALAAATIGAALRYAVIALIGTLTAWITGNMALEALRKKKLADLQAKKNEAIAQAKAKKEIAASLASEGYTAAEIAAITGQYDAEVKSANAGGLFADIASTVKWVVVGGIVYKGAEKMGVI